jgi:hypothetical protein
MSRDNIIWVDFRFSKDIRGSQVISFAERLKARNASTRSHRHASNSALETLRLMLDSEFSNRKPTDKA